MGRPTELQLSRIEMKYIIRPEVAAAVRDFVGSYLELDEYGATQPDWSYPVHSLYLDSDDLKLYWSTINGNKNRYKLRLRFYENRPKAPVYFEIKRRVNNAILKQRCALKREAVEVFVGGQLPDPAQLVSRDTKQWVAAQRFHQLMTEGRCTPRAHVSYRREAWVQPDDNALRLTMDREVLCGPEFTCSLEPRMREPHLVFGDAVILELKFTGRFPDWFRQLVSTFHLTQCSAAKYVDGVALIGEHHFNRGLAAMPGPDSLRNRAERVQFLEHKCGGPGVPCPVNG